MSSVFIKEKAPQAEQNHSFAAGNLLFGKWNDLVEYGSDFTEILGDGKGTLCTEALNKAGEQDFDTLVLFQICSLAFLRQMDMDHPLIKAGACAQNKALLFKRSQDFVHLALEQAGAADEVGGRHRRIPGVVTQQETQHMRFIECHRGDKARVPER